MASRMEKYHSNTSDASRSMRNTNLYKDIYEDTEYSNIEGIATMDKTNEISLEQIRDLLKERENFKKISSVEKKDVPKVYHKPVPERSYDIRDVLIKAKDEHVEDKQNRSLRNTQYNILKNINVKDNVYDDEEIERTLVNTGVLKGFDDNELSLDMLSDLKSTGNTIVDKTNASLLLSEVKEAKDNYEPKDESSDGLDKSFYTSSLNFKEDDFEQLKDLQDSIDSNNKLIKVLFFLLFLIIAGIIGFVVFKMI